MPQTKKTPPKKADTPQVAVIIVCWNNQDLLDECFQSVYDQTYKNWRIITIDNGSSDDSVKVINEGHPKVELVLPGKNLGFAVANNIGIKKAFENSDCEYVLLLNTDARIKADWMEKMVAFAQTHPDGAGFQSLTVDYYNHDIIDSCGILVDQSALATQMGYRLKNVALETRKVFGVNAAAALFSRKFLASQPFGEDYFDSDLFMYLEDVDLATRSIMLGWSNYFVNETVAYHMGSASSGKNPGFSLYMTYRNNGPVLLKNLPFSILRKIFPGLLGAEFARIRGFAREGKYRLIWQIIRGRLKSLVMLPMFYRKRKKLQKLWEIGEPELWKLMAHPHLRRLTPKELGNTEMPTTIVVVCRNDINTLSSSLNSLLSQSYQHKEILVIDNGSTDGSLKYLEDKFPSLRVIINPQDFGLAGGFNEGIVLALTDLPEYIALARADVIYDKDWLRNMVGSLTSDLDVFAVSAAVKHGGEIIAGYDYTPGHIPRLHKNASKRKEIFAPHSLGTLYRTEWLQKTGLFDGHFFSGLEEVDLAFRAHNMGLKIYFEPSAQATQETSVLHPQTPTPYHTHKNAYFIFIKNTPAKIMLQSLPGAFSGTCAALAAMTLSGHPIIPLKIIVKCALKTPRMLLSRSINQKMRTQKAESIRKILRSFR